MCNAVTVSTLLRIFDAHEENHFFWKTVFIHPSVETYIQTTLKYTTSRWVDLFFQGELEIITRKTRRIRGCAESNE